jgi:hypothetical protein
MMMTEAYVISDESDIYQWGLPSVSVMISVSISDDSGLVQ